MPMRLEELIRLHDEGRKRYVVLRESGGGVLVALDLEGRIFSFFDGEVVSRVNADAVLKESHAGEYQNPGGDALWPAPEGSRVGYLYSTGEWRVPPGLSGARYRVLSQKENSAHIRAEIDLVTSLGHGVPTAFDRAIRVTTEPGRLNLTVTDSIEYLGARELSPSEARLAPWTLSQFDTSPGMEVVFPEVSAESIHDFYEPSDELRELKDGLWHVKTEGGRRFQIGMAAAVPWIELRVPWQNATIRRTAAPLPEGQRYIDIADSAPADAPGDFAARYSVYNDAGSFMEIEAAGPCFDRLARGAAVSHEVVTEFRLAPESRTD